MDIPARVRWQCRRGSKELDWLLQRYLNTVWPPADAVEMRQIEDLLQLDDCELTKRLLILPGLAMPSETSLNT